MSAATTALAAQMIEARTQREALPSFKLELRSAATLYSTNDFRSWGPPGLGTSRKQGVVLAAGQGEGSSWLAQQVAELGKLIGDQRGEPRRLDHGFDAAGQGELAAVPR